jgi:ferritin-like metal-binding protein YciE
MEMESLRDLFIDELKDLYSAENQILKALPKMIKKAASKELKSGFEQHLKETQGHVENWTKAPEAKSARAWKALLRMARNGWKKMPSRK